MNPRPSANLRQWAGRWTWEGASFHATDGHRIFVCSEDMFGYVFSAK